MTDASEPVVYYRHLLRRRWRTLLAAVVSGVVGGTACSALIVLLIHRQLSGQGAGGAGTALLFAGTITAYLTLGLLSEYLLISLAQDELRSLRVRLSRRALELPYEDLEAIGGPGLLAALTDDLDRVALSVRRLATLIVSGSLVFGAAAYLVWLSAELFVACAVVLWLCYRLYRRPLYDSERLQRYWSQLRDRFDELVRHFDGLARGSRELLLHERRRQSFLESAIEDTSDRMRDISVRAATWQSAFFRLGEAAYYLVLGGLLFAVPAVMDVDPAVTSGFVIAGLYVLLPLTSIMNFGPDFGEARMSLNRLAAFGLFDGAGERDRGDSDTTSPPHRPDRPTTTVRGRRVTLKGVRYAHRSSGGDRPFRLGPIDLQLTPGELTFLTGSNGSGKSTLFRVVCGLYPPSSGNILLDGTPIRADDIEGYRQNFAVVFNDFHLFDRFYGLDPALVESLGPEWLRRLELDGVVEIRDGGLSTTRLSQGQRKRLALLTAILEDRPVYLFDEWAAEQDPRFKAVFYEKILPWLKAEGRATLVVTHDDRWFSTADHIVKLADGRVAESYRTDSLTPGGTAPA